MTDSKPQAEFAQLEIAGRPITVRRPTEGQTIMIRRAMRIGEAQVAVLEKLEDAKDADEDVLADARMKGLDAVSDMLDMIERLVVDRGDREFLLEQLKEGTIDVPDFFPITTAFAKPEKATKGAKAKLVK
jgi:hypothetical protein